MSQPAARLGDMHSCPMVDPGPKPHVGGPILPPCAPTVLIGGPPAARKGDMAVCVGPTDSIVQGSFTVLIEKKAAARMGDSTTHGGKIVSGCPTVLIGNTAKVIGTDAAVALFAQLASQKQIPFDYPVDCCNSRAHEMCRIMKEEGIECKKVWNYGDLALETPNTPWGSVNWGWHVAPVVAVQSPGGAVQGMVMDPSIESGPVSVQDWQSHQGDLGSTLQESNADEYLHHAEPPEYDPDYSKTKKRFEKHQQSKKEMWGH